MKPVMILTLAIIAAAYAQPQDRVKVADTPDFSVRVVDQPQSSGFQVDPGFYRPTATRPTRPIRPDASFPPIDINNGGSVNGPNQYPYRPNDGVARVGR
nr:P13 [Ephestia kuehniella]